MGFFNNMLPVRLPVNTSLSWIDWIGQVRAAVVEAFAHQDVPFERIAHVLEAEQPGVHARLYQCMFSFQDARSRPTHWGPLAHERVRIKHKGATEDLNLWLVEIPSGIEGGIQYDTHLYLPETARALHERFVALLDAVSRAPHQTVAQLTAPSPAEQTRVLALDAPAAAPAQSLFNLLEQRATAPSVPALLRVGATELDAKELLRRVNEHASQLETRLPAAGHPLTVAIAMQEPVTQLATALAVLRLGHRCLPLTPGDTPPADAVALGDAPWLQSQGSPTARKPAAQPQAFDAALIAQISAGLARQAHLLVGDSLRASAHAVGTALALLGLALHTGGRLVLWDQAPDGATLVADIQRERTGLVLANANTWADALQARRGASLSVIAAVDARDNSPELVAHLLDAGLSVLNVLQTEALPLPLAVHWVADAAEAAVVGRPLVAQTVRIAEQPDRASPLGVAAPVWVKADPAGAWIASHAAARWRSDGLLQHVDGTSDATALLCGHLMDLEALEQTALALPGVEAAATQAVVDTGGRRRLVMGLQVGTLSADQRDAHARALLDAVPAEARAAVEVRWFEQIVRHPSGRLQLAQSRALKAQASPGADTFAGTPTEQAIHAVWSELLGMAHIGRNDNFFDLGGTSLTAMQAVLKLEQQIGKQISPRRYVSETLAQLAVAYDATGTEAPATPVTQAAEPAPGLMKRLARLVQRA